MFMHVGLPDSYICWNAGSVHFPQLNGCFVREKSKESWRHSTQEFVMDSSWIEPSFPCIGTWGLLNISYLHVRWNIWRDGTCAQSSRRRKQWQLWYNMIRLVKLGHNVYPICRGKCQGSRAHVIALLQTSQPRFYIHNAADLEKLITSVRNGGWKCA
jgi:hypothetical protein